DHDPAYQNCSRDAWDARGSVVIVAAIVFVLCTIVVSITAPPVLRTPEKMMAHIYTSSCME
ncbi:hypothetical protein, partial [Sulfitobacter sp. HI0076]|uniref:hypothetical protein n=1 Tax=Sulfitobacter sp. HI0076 TaxID=1822251 RepID=UPI001F43D340